MALCRAPVDRYTERRDLRPLTRVVGPQHRHYGYAIYRWAICRRHHFHRAERLRVEWAKCLKCLQQQAHVQLLSRRREYLLAKARREKREVPSFLREEALRLGELQQKEGHDLSRASTPHPTHSSPLTPPPSPS